MKKLFRKVAHKRYIDKYINEMRWETLNTVLTASRTQWNDDVVSYWTTTHGSSVNTKGEEDG